jgi:PhzF family phenazine biosynthesis protein
MQISLYQIDAFTNHCFGGNPAAVCPLERWIPDTTMQAIATGNNLSETAFFVPKGSDFEIRWYTPVAEIDFSRP